MDPVLRLNASACKAKRRPSLSVLTPAPSHTRPTSCLNESGLLTPPSEHFDRFSPHIEECNLGSDNNSLDASSPTTVAVIGVGYVGFQLVRAFSEHYPVIAYDVSTHRIDAVRHDFDERSVHLTSDPTEIARATHILIAVPTRVHQDTKTVDTSHLQSAIQTLATHAKSGVVVVVESSVAVGMTRDLLGHLKLSKKFKIGMSPERVDPGRTNIAFEVIPKVVSGLDDESLQAIQQLYEPVFDRVVPVSSCEVAEMTKLYENCQRMICIAYANEMADACHTFGINPFEVCSAAATKPFGYQSYLPGAGVGGHCIPVNPYYLLSNMHFPLLQSATEKMWQRPAALVDSVMDSLSKRQGNWKTHDPELIFRNSTTSTSSPRVLVVGVAFKPGQSVTSHSPALAMIDHLADNYDDVHIEFCDPLVDSEMVPHVTKMNETTHWNVETLDSHYDAVIVAMAQHGLDLGVLDHLQKTEVFDFTASLKGFGLRSDKPVFGAKRDSGVAL